MDQKQLAADLFNSTWNLIDKHDRDEEETLKMIHMAHASRYLWGEVGSFREWTRGEWLISRVYAIAEMGEAALYHGKYALKYSIQGKVGALDDAFAFEAVARAYSVLGDDEQKKEYIEKAKEAAKDIERKDDYDYFMSELATIK